MTNVIERKSNLVMPVHYAELDSEEMSYVEGGISLSSNGLYFSNTDIVAITQVVGYNVYAVAAGLSALSSWICSTGIGTILWGLFSLSSVYVAIKAISAVLQGKGLMLSIEWAKIWFIKVPCGLNLDVR